MQPEFRPGVVDLTPQIMGITRRLLVDAAILPGMRVLDLGCGRGDVSLLLAEMVGDSGRVVGIDRDGDALAQARRRAAEMGYSTLEFIHTDLEMLSSETAPFDAVTTRRTLMYLNDPVAVLRRATLMLKPGGTVAIQEHDGSHVPLGPCELELQRRVIDWTWRTVAHEGANVGIGFALPSIVAAAGLHIVSTRVEGIIQSPSTHHPIGGLARMMMPRIEAAGVATAAEIAPDTLDDRLIAERAAANATVLTDLIFCVISRKPA